MAKVGSKRVRAAAFAAAIEEVLQEYETVTVGTLNRAIDQTAALAAKKAKDMAPRSNNIITSGDYADSITWEHVRTTKEGVHQSVVKSEAPYYRRTHLLEHGHAKVGGGRVAPSPAGGHWAPAEKLAIAELVNVLKKELSK